MEELDQQILEELKAKAIERGDDDISIDDNTLDEEEPQPDLEPKKKSKKVRSEKQKAAFEKARLARSENIRIKREIAAEKKAEKKKEKEAVKAEVEKRLKTPKVLPVKEDADEYLQQPTIPQAYEQQVVNNYYYYGEQPAPPKKKRGRKPRAVVRPPTPSESESESEDESGGDNFVYEDEEEEAEMPQSYKELQNYSEEVHRPNQESDNPQLKFRFA